MTLETLEHRPPEALDVPAASPREGPQRGRALALESVRRYFGSTVAAQDVDLHVAPGELLCLLGPSGCGKTTLLRIAAGLERPQHGRVRIDERVVADAARGVWLPAEARNVGLVFQDAVLFPHLTVLENVSFGLDELPAPDRGRRALSLLEPLGLGHLARSYPHALSGGQQQRVALARALAPSPRVMLLDEPFSGLDSRLRDRIRDDTLHLLEASGTATLLVTHDPEEALFMADRIAVMRDGRIVQQGTPLDVYCRPVDPFVARFFGEVNEVEGRVESGRVQTPVGPLAAPHLPDGSRVRVLIRRDGLRVTPVSRAHGAPGTHVVTSRLLGRSSLIHLCVHHDGREHHMHAEVPGIDLPPAQQAVEVRLDARQAFVFPAGAD